MTEIRCPHCGEIVARYAEPNAAPTEPDRQPSKADFDRLIEDYPWPKLQGGRIRVVCRRNDIKTFRDLCRVESRFHLQLLPPMGTIGEKSAAGAEHALKTFGMRFGMLPKIPGTLLKWTELPGWGEADAGAER